VALVEQHAAIAAHKVELVALERQVLETDLTQNFDIIINATASSLAGADVPARQRAARTQSGLRHDVRPRRPEFSELGRSHGALARDGLGMLVEQAAESFALWRGVRPPSAQVLAELRALLLTEAAH
jgi:shikimate dehydrogenase